MSLGMDMGWRHRLVDALQIGPDDRVLDLGTGTADVALLEAARGAAAVLGVDPSANMLAVGRKKVGAASPGLTLPGQAGRGTAERPAGRLKRRPQQSGGGLGGGGRGW